MPPRTKTTNAGTDAGTKAPSGGPVDTITGHPEDMTPLARNIAIATAAAWLPESGAFLTGELVMVRKGDSAYGDYPVLIIDPHDGNKEPGKFVAVHAFHTILQTELLKLRPKSGDVLTFAYMGQEESNASKRAYAAAVATANGDATKLTKAETDRVFYHLYVLLTGDGTSADAVKVEAFGWDDVEKSASTKVTDD